MILNEEQLSELLENMYWEFDARRSGYNQWKELSLIHISEPTRH